MNLGVLEIKKAFLGGLELSPRNAYLGQYSIIKDRPAPVEMDYFYYENVDDKEILVQVINKDLIDKQGLECSRDQRTWQSMQYLYVQDEIKEVSVDYMFDKQMMIFFVRHTTTVESTAITYWNPDTCDIYYNLSLTFTFSDKDNQQKAVYLGVSKTSGSYVYYMYCIPEVTYENYQSYHNAMRLATYNPDYKADGFAGSVTTFTSSMSTYIFDMYMSGRQVRPAYMSVSTLSLRFQRGSIDVYLEDYAGKTTEILVPAHWEGIPMSIGIGKKLYIRNKAGQEIDGDMIGYREGFISASGLHNVGGNILTIFDYSITDALEWTRDMNGIFMNDTTLISAEKLSFDQYDGVGSHNASIDGKSGPDIQSYMANMFKGCSSLTTAPNISTLLKFKGSYTTLAPANGGFLRMFEGCTSLINAPALPTTTLAGHCYLAMFQGCTSLTSAPALPATTLAASCYYNMFNGCTSLINDPALPATTLTNYCYQLMFYGCTSLTSAPALPATTLAGHCYNAMFLGCVSLTAAPALPATTLAASCYYNMFRECASLTAAPALPAATLATLCYFNMFNRCTSLTSAPILPATSLVSTCYSSMFYGCSSLSEVTTYAASWNESYANNWLYGVAPTGTFYNLGNAEIPTDSTSGCPTGWTLTTTKP